MSYKQSIRDSVLRCHIISAGSQCMLWCCLRPFLLIGLNCSVTSRALPSLGAGLCATKHLLLPCAVVVECKLGLQAAAIRLAILRGLQPGDKGLLHPRQVQQAPVACLLFLRVNYCQRPGRP